ncbi:purple acid phosphatase family protein [Woodsholea maritima]|uniref:purple acid phosphatase family protein n=1 Tax=Woodsholea maritima TaxID=240237 RepID=UPI00037C5327|nr:metallophosphoesterase family protein [Woodsholea maritima]
MLRGISTFALLSVLGLGACASTGGDAVTPNSETSEAVAFHPFMPGVMPDRVILNLTQDPSTSMAVNWRSDASAPEGFVQYAVATDGPGFNAVRETLTAESELTHIQDEGEPLVVAHYHSATLEGLTPNTQYVYRVGDGSHWSEWFQFTTAGLEGEPFSFIYFGDAQNDLKSMWSRVIREAYKTLPSVNFMLHAGDLINSEDSDIEWGEWFYAGGFLHAQVPSVMTPGNHEYSRQMELSQQWRPGFNLPKNGPEGVENLSETVYYVDYQDMRLISLDADMSGDFESSARIQAQWLDQVLRENDKRWTAIFLHYPFYSTRAGRHHENLHTFFKPIIDRYGVDIVLQGHDHGYSRGMVANVPDGEMIRDERTGTMYVVSVSGPKMYPVEDLAWADRKANGLQLFQVLTVDGDTLSYQAYTASGRLYDAFDIQKSDTGPNQLINRIPEDAEEIWEPDYDQPSSYRRP